MKQRPTYAEWMELPSEQRNALVLQFNINKSTGVRVQNKRVISDGVSEQDLENALHLGKMIEFLGSDWKEAVEYDTEMLADVLWEMVLRKMFGVSSKPESEADQKTGTADSNVNVFAGSAKKEEDPLADEEEALDNVNIGSDEKLSTEKIN